MAAERRGLTLVVGSFAAAAVTSALLLVLPLGETVTTSIRTGPDGRDVVASERTRETLVDREGRGIAVVLAVPVAVAGVPLLVRSGRAGHAARTLAAGLLCLGVLVAGFSIGLFYLPSALMRAIAAFRDRPNRVAALAR